MKKIFLTAGLAAMLSACGGGGAQKSAEVVGENPFLTEYKVGTLQACLYPGNGRTGKGNRCYYKSAFNS